MDEQSYGQSDHHEHTQVGGGGPMGGPQQPLEQLQTGDVGRPDQTARGPDGEDQCEESLTGTQQRHHTLYRVTI